MFAVVRLLACRGIRIQEHRADETLLLTRYAEVNQLTLPNASRSAAMVDWIVVMTETLPVCNKIKLASAPDIRAIRTVPNRGASSWADSGTEPMLLAVSEDAREASEVSVPEGGSNGRVSSTASAEGVPEETIVMFQVQDRPDRRKTNVDEDIQAKQSAMLTVST